MILREYRSYVLSVRYRKEVDALNINKQAQGQYYLQTLLHLIFLHDSQIVHLCAQTF